MIPEFLHQALAVAPHQRLPFVDYMELVLYHPIHGYYNRQNSPLGLAGDFVTSAYLGADFAELIATQLQQFWQHLDCPGQFTVVEMGAGEGLVARDILTYAQDQFPDFFAALEYVIIERSARLRQQQETSLQAWAENKRLHWCTWAELPGGIRGCFFSNELVDALPVHRLRLSQGQLWEVYVQLDPATNQLVETLGDLSDPGLEDYFAPIGITLTPDLYPEGYTTEVNLMALAWLRQVSQHLSQGFVLTIDYGYPASSYYHPHRIDGTLQAYHQHRYHANPYIHIGAQDLTAHVDFTALQVLGKTLGLEPILFTHQAPWLMALGLGDRLVANNQTNANLHEVLRRRDQLQQLIDPLGLGGLRVLCQAKQVENAADLFPDWGPLF